MRTVDPVKHEAKRRHILEAAADCFSTKGFQGTRTADICAAAGISSGNLFHYFPSKQAIFTAIFEQDGTDNAELFARAMEADDSLEALLGFADFMVSQTEYPHLAGLMLEVIANAKRDSDFTILLDRNDRENRDGLTLLLRKAADAGQIDPTLDPVSAANWIMLLIEGTFVRASAGSDFRPHEERSMLRRMITRFLAPGSDATS